MITQSSLRLLAGSEINTLELADYLQNAGARVTVYTYFFSEPISVYFKEKNIRVVTDDTQLNIYNFDYVWVHHQVIPVSFVDAIKKGFSPKLPAFIYLHMSGLETHFLEHAHIFGLEEKIASRVLYISEGAKKTLRDLTLQGKDFSEMLYPNPAPLSFVLNGNRIRRELSKILIVSNHPPNEIVEAMAILKSRDVKVVFAGEKQDEYRLIDLKYLEEFDVVVTIGKTVQYCLVADINVYIYDVWGGPGYLDSKNEKKALVRNFSGRGFEKKSPEYIASEIQSKYDKAAGYQRTNHDRYIDAFSANVVIPSVLKDLTPRHFEKFDPYYAQYIKESSTMLKYKFYHENLLVKKEEELLFLNDELRNTQNEIIRVREENFELYQRIDKILYSKSFRIGKAITTPIRQARSILRKAHKK